MHGIGRLVKGVLIVIILGGWYRIGLANDISKVASQPDIEQGREIYQIHCLECHGEHGRGDGPHATTLAPRPGNLVSAAISSKTDDELFAVISKGVPRTAMNGWEDQLSLDDRRNVVAYIRSLVHFQ